MGLRLCLESVTLQAMKIRPNLGFPLAKDARFASPSSHNDRSHERSPATIREDNFDVCAGAEIIIFRCCGDDQGLKCYAFQPATH